MPLFTVTVNTPGYLPEDDDPASFDNIEDARAYALEQVEREAEAMEERYPTVDVVVSPDSDTAPMCWVVSPDDEHALLRVVEISEQTYEEAAYVAIEENAAPLIAAGFEPRDSEPGEWLRMEHPDGRVVVVEPDNVSREIPAANLKLAAHAAPYIAHGWRVLDHEPGEFVTFEDNTDSADRAHVYIDQEGAHRTVTLNDPTPETDPVSALATKLEEEADVMGEFAEEGAILAFALETTGLRVTEDVGGYIEGELYAGFVGGQLHLSRTAELAAWLLSQLETGHAVKTDGPIVHRFRDSGTAYNATQTSWLIRDGDVLVVEPENVVGILSEAWPVALSENTGEFHRMDPDTPWTAVPLTSGETRDYSASVEIADAEIARLAEPPTRACPGCGFHIPGPEPETRAAWCAAPAWCVECGGSAPRLATPVGATAEEIGQLRAPDGPRAAAACKLYDGLTGPSSL